MDYYKELLFAKLCLIMDLTDMDRNWILYMLLMDIYRYKCAL